MKKTLTVALAAAMLSAPALPAAAQTLSFSETLSVSVASSAVATQDRRDRRDRGERREDRRDRREDRREDRWERREERREDRWERREDRREHRAERRQYERWQRAQRRYAASRYYAPRGYQVRSWSYGQRMPHQYRTNRYVINDYHRYGLYAPPHGYQYVRSGNDVVLAAVTTGLVVAVIASLFQ